MTRTMQLFLGYALAAAAVAAAAAACTGEADVAADHPNLTGLEPPPEGAGLQLHSSFRVEPGREALDCRYLVLPDLELDIGRLEHAYTRGSHHMLLYPTSLRPDQVAHGESFDCTGGDALGQTGVLYGGGEPTGELAYPDGVGLRLPPRSVVLLESHYLNASDEPLDAEVRVNLWYAAQPVTVEAGTLFFRNWAVYLPPAPAQASASMRCRIPGDVSLLYATSHMHRRGLAFESTLVRPGEEPLELHRTHDWESPVPAVFWPTLELSAGDRIDFTCDYQNDRPTPVIEGESADRDEMCVFIGGYWPRLPGEAELCLGEGSAPLLDGSQSCASTVDCMLGAGVGNEVGGQACIADTCAASAPSLSRFLVCVERFDCWGSQSCVAFHCSAEWDLCAAATCAPS